MLRYDWTFLEDLGYDRNAIYQLGDSWPEGLRQMLTDQDFREDYTENIQTMLAVFDRGMVLELLVNYPGSFAQKPEYFRKRLTQLQKRVPGWAQMIAQQLHSGGDAIFEHIGDSQTRWTQALEKVDPEDRIEWSLVRHVRQASGVVLDVNWLLREHGLEYLLSLEAARFEIAENAGFLAERGVNCIGELIVHHAWPFQYPAEEFAAKYAVLEQQYGADLPLLLEANIDLFEQMY